MFPKRQLHTGLVTLLEVGVLFLPAIPAYLWLWPYVEGVSWWGLQILAYVYVLVGTLYIGRRRWNWGQLGINRHGWWLSLICGLTIIAGRTLVILSVAWDLTLPRFDLVRIVGEIMFYFGLVGVVEELLFRGLVYQTLDRWLGSRWAIWGSSLGFGLWHVFGQGPVIGATAVFYGLIFALMRWRAGGIVGLIFVHGLMDFTAVQMLPDTDVLGLGRPDIAHPALLFLGLGLILAVPLYLWLVHPRLNVEGRKR